MHKALLPIALLCLVALAGCADSGGDDGTTGGPAASSTTTTTGPPPKPKVYSDTLHFLEAPEMGLVLPAGLSEIQTATDSFGRGFGPGGNDDDEPSSQWAYQVNATSKVASASVHVWIEIVEQLVQAPSFPPTEPTCTWYVSLALGADAEPLFECIGEPVGVIAPDTKELVFDFPGLDAELEANETITVRFGRTVFSTSPNNSVFILSGTEAHDTRAVLTGLKEEVVDPMA